MKIRKNNLIINNKSQILLFLFNKGEILFFMKNNYFIINLEKHKNIKSIDDFKKSKPMNQKKYKN